MPVSDSRVLRLDESFGYLFRQANRAFTRLLARRLKPHGITLAQWYFLRELWREDGITQRELSRRMDVAEPTTKVAIDLMEKARLIRRRRAPLQGNGVYVHLTPKGRSLEARLVHIAGEVNRSAIHNISRRELSALRGATMRMIDNLGKAVDG